jgi:hypothetical protein
VVTPLAGLKAADSQLLVRHDDGLDPAAAAQLAASCDAALVVVGLDWQSEGEHIHPGDLAPVLREMPDELYVLYQRDYGVTIARAEERLAAIAASAEDALLLGLRAGTPLLEIARIAHDLNGVPVERRVTLLDTDAHRYVANLD